MPLVVKVAVPVLGSGTVISTVPLLEKVIVPVGVPATVEATVAESFNPATPAFVPGTVLNVILVDARCSTSVCGVLELVA